MGWSQQLSTLSVPPRERLAMWREVFGQTIAHLDIAAVDDAPFHAEGSMGLLPGAAFASISGSPVVGARTRPLIAADPTEMLYLISASAPLAVSQGGREHILATGDAIFLHGSEVSRIESRQHNRYTNIAVALDDLRQITPAADDLAMRIVPRSSDLLGLLHGYVDMLRVRAGSASEAASLLAARHIRELFAAIAADAHDGSAQLERPAIKTARLHALKTDIATHLCEPSLNIAGVALRAGVSPRYVRRLFQEDGASFSAYVLDARLERAHRLLLHPGRTSLSIAAIAYGCGFGDLSYFNRCFQRRFGMTPSTLRRGGR